MSIIKQIVSAHAARRKERREAKDEWEKAVLSPQAIRTRRYRGILVCVLILIGTISFIEVVLVPGSMIRRNLAHGSEVASVNVEADKEPRLPAWLMTEEQKAKFRQQHLDQIEQTLRATHLKLGNAYAALTDARLKLTEYSGEKLHVVPAVDMQSSVAPSLADVLETEPTGKVAWARIIEVSSRAKNQLRDAREELDLVGSRFAAGSFLAEDDNEMKASIRALEETSLATAAAKNFVDHIATLQRQKAALAHQASVEKSRGDSK